MPAQAIPRYPWLVMLYLAGDNSLDEDMVLALQELQAEGAPTGDRIVAQLDPSGAGRASQRYDFSVPKPRARHLEDYRVPFAATESNTGNPRTLTDFITWAVKKHGGRKVRTFLILSGHGSGTTEDFFLRDENPTDSLSILELAEALRAATVRVGSKLRGKRIDVLGMDACYMSMGEVAYQIRDHVDYMVGAEGLEPTFGWPYRRILARAKAHRKDRKRPMTPEEMTTAIVEEYVECYSDYDRTAGRSVDLAAIDLRQVTDVKDAFQELVSVLRARDRRGSEHDDPEVLPRPFRCQLTGSGAVRIGQGPAQGPVRRRYDRKTHDKILLAHWYAQTYKSDQFVDLIDLCEQLRKQFDGDGDGEVQAKCTAVLEALRRCVVVSGCSGFACQHSYGLSIYFPWGLVSRDYAGKLAFGRETRWEEFLRTHIRATRRESRFERGAPRPDSLRDVGSVPGTLHESVTRLLPAVNQGDLTVEDAANEITRRILGHSRHSEHTKYSEGTRHSEHTKSRDERETWVKNLPPVIGTAYWRRAG